MRFRLAVTAAVVMLSSSLTGVRSGALEAAAISQAPRTNPGARRVEPAVPFHVGETLTYNVSWSPFVVAGTAVATVAEKKPSLNSIVYAIVADGRPLPLVARVYALYYKIDTLIDSFTLLPQQGSIYSEEGDRRETATTRFDRSVRKAFYEARGETTVNTDFSIPMQTQDGLSALYALRAMALRAGARVEMPVANDGALFTVSVEVSGPERVRVPFGDFEALNLGLTILDSQRQPVGRNMAVWISTDAQHLPVKLQAELPVGNFVLALKDVK